MVRKLSAGGQLRAPEVMEIIWKLRVFDEFYFCIKCGFQRNHPILIHGPRGVCHILHVHYIE